MVPAPDENHPVRRRPFPNETRRSHNRPVLLLATVCSQNRKRIFDRKSSSDSVVASWKAHGDWIVGRYVFMPDHIHFFCSPGDQTEPRLDVWMKKWKAQASRNWSAPSEQPIWQTGHWDRQLRGHEHYDERWEYVRQNPVRAGLCASPEEWPWQGEIHRLVW